MTEYPATVSQKTSRITFFSIGAVLLLLGILVMLGWWLKIAPLVQLVPGFAAMVFNTALCFTLLGTALMLAGLSPVRHERAQLLLGGLTVVIAALALSQDLFGIDLGIDRLFNADWLHDEYQHRTRMAPNTALAFILGGATLILIHRGRARWMRIVAQYTALAVGLIGLIGLLGYVLGLEFLFAWYPYARMAAHTATGFTLLGIGLWVCWRRAGKNAEQTVSPDARIALTGGMILVAMASTAGIVGFLLLVQQTEATLKRGLQVSLHNRVEVYRDNLNNAVMNVREIALRPTIQRELQRWHATPGHPEALDFLRRASSNYIGLGMSAVALDDANGRRVAHAGNFAHAPALRVPLKLPHRTELLWENGLVLHTRLPVIVEKQVIGSITAEQRLSLLTQMFENVRGLGETGEMVLCATRGDQIDCFPTRLRPEAFTLPRRMQGKLLPIAVALDGFQDVSQMVDYRGKQVIAAYSPVHQTGLGMVIKMNVEELYQPIHRQFQQILLLLLVLTVGGILLLRWQVMPLARRLIESERGARENELRWRFALEGSQNGVWDWDLNTNTVFFSQRWKEMLGYEEHEISMDLQEWDKRVHPDDKTRVYADIEKHMKGDTAYYENEHRMMCKNGTYKWILDRGMIVSRDANGKPARMIGTHTDITDRKQNEETIRELSLIDELTGLRNRRGFMTLAEAEFLLARRMKRALTLFYADLNGMKTINDTLGHAEGDNALRDIADILGKVFRDSDIIARLGGDEFAVLALEISDLKPEHIIQRLEASVAEYNRVSRRRYTLSLSIGAVHIEPETDASLNELLKQADEEMYRVKQKRRTTRGH